MGADFIVGIKTAMKLNQWSISGKINNLID